MSGADPTDGGSVENGETFRIVSTGERYADAADRLIDDVFGPGRWESAAGRLRAANESVRGLSYVSVTAADAVAASVSFWPIRVSDTPGLLLGPLAVERRVRGRGVGRALMTHALRRVDVDGPPFVLLVGDYAYYARSGFMPAPSGLVMPAPVAPERVLVRGRPDVLAALRGRVRADSGRRSRVDPTLRTSGRAGCGESGGTRES